MVGITTDPNNQILYKRPIPTIKRCHDIHAYRVANYLVYNPYNQAIHAYGIANYLVYIPPQS